MQILQSPSLDYSYLHFTGRSVNTCRSAFQNMKRSAEYLAVSNVEAHTSSHDYPGSLRETSHSVVMLEPTGRSIRRILPRARTWCQEGMTVDTPRHSLLAWNQNKRKRGRPTKAEAQAKAARIASVIKDVEGDEAGPKPHHVPSLVASTRPETPATTDAPPPNSFSGG